jgi:alpha-D-ribose 1-methylphosphonate 5-triphosphate synthase subunit PhnG
LIFEQYSYRGAVLGLEMLYGRAGGDGAGEKQALLENTVAKFSLMMVLYWDTVVIIQGRALL